MVSTKELMTGDLVAYAGADIRIARISENFVTYFTPWGKNGSVYEDNLFPILLTEKILEANGFIHDEIAGSWNHRQPNFEILGSDKSGWMIFDCITIKSVHELQNAMRLCELQDFADKIKLG